MAHLGDETYSTVNAVRDFIETNKEAFSSMEESAFSAFQSIIEISNNATAKWIQNAEMKAQASLSALNEEVMGQEAYAAAVEAINNDLNEKKRQAALQEAERAKQFAIFQITVDTAKAVVGALGAAPFTPFNIISAGLVGAAGALQLAAVLSQPVPGYFMGREGGDAEVAYVGEQGREIIKTNDGMYLTPASKTLTYLPQGADVIPAPETSKMLAQGFDVKELKELNGKLDKLINVINLKPETAINITEKGMFTVVKRGTNRTKYIGGLKR
jgi:hypothetical protein